MKNPSQSWGLMALFAIGTIARFLCEGRTRVSAQVPIEFGVSLEYGAIELGPGQKTVVENTNNSHFQMQVLTRFIGNDGLDLIPSVSATIPPNKTSEIPFTPHCRR
jgi:hypothetical protein